MLEKVLSVAAVQQHRDQLAYGLAFLLWGVVSYVEVEAYGAGQTAEMVLSIQLFTSLVAILVMAAGIDGERGFKPHLLLNVDTLRVRIDILKLPLIERLPLLGFSSH